jgi:aldose 1-epimerase
MTITHFGTTPSGESVEKITLAKGALTVSLLTYGGIVQSVRLAGVGHDLTLGSDSLSDYLGPMKYHGAIIAPVANRIAKAEAVIAGQTHRFEPNEGSTCLHSGPSGAHTKVWQIADANETEATLTLTLPDGAGGFPGNRLVSARFAVEDDLLRLDISVETDAETLWNATNHSYWRLDGGPSWLGHKLQVLAEHWLPVDAQVLPTGQIAPVAGGDMDFRRLRAISPGAPALDHNFCLSAGQVPLRDVLVLQGPQGLTMTVATTEPGIQVYDGRGPKRDGDPAYEGLAIESQGWPDAPSQAAFPTITLKAGERRVQTTTWRFAR